ncbi:hypothetical protein HHK36_019289 [Tetracentron sinense]|uniref:Uncharacterized protein n=1 Tax=Tetracentron sinense TaxID=13715 RepID=A0A835D914_TETSI|nr:hypothetical protein HHK36_019289 [Tetracentron sinense]
MVGFSAVKLPLIPSIARPLPALLINSHIVPSFPIRTPTQNPRNLRRVVVSAENENGLSKEEPKEKENGYNGQEDLKRDWKPIFNLRWRDLLDPDPENILAVGLTGLLTWASVQVLWQLFFISVAIVVAAVKYSFIAALLLFILITLL